jgi:hypothetical protein
MHDPLHQSERSLAERSLGPPSGAKQIGDEWKISPAHMAKHQRRATCGDDTTMDLGGFEIRVHGRLDIDQVAITTELIEEDAKVRKRHIRRIP